MIYIPERSRDFLFKSINSHLTTNCFFFNPNQATSCPDIYLDRYSVHRGELCWDDMGDRELPSWSDLIIQSVASMVCGQKSHTLQQNFKSRITQNCNFPMLLHDKMCLPNGNHHNNRYYSPGSRCAE